MKEQVETIYITEDGLRFRNEKEALAHEKTIKSKRFESSDAMITLFKETDIWKNWVESLNVDKSDVFAFKSKVEVLTENLSKDFPENFIGNSNTAENLEIPLWKHFEPEAIIAYFKVRTTLNLPEEKILRIFNATDYYNGYLADRLDEFAKFIGVLNIAFNRQNNN